MENNSSQTRPMSCFKRNIGTEISRFQGDVEDEHRGDFY